MERVTERVADDTARWPHIHRHAATAWRVISIPSAPRHHVCLHTVPGAKGTLVRDMINVTSLQRE